MRRALRERSRENLQSAVHEIALYIGTPVAAVAAWASYAASGWDSGGVGEQVRGAVLAWVGASLVVLAVQGARFGDRGDAALTQSVPEHPLRYAARYAVLFSLYLLAVLLLVLTPLALVLSV